MQPGKAMTVQGDGLAAVRRRPFSCRKGAALTFLEFLGSAAFGAICGAFVALYNNERQIRIKNVTKERAKWREKIRSNATEISRAATGDDKAKSLELRRELSLHLNAF